MTPIKQPWLRITLPLIIGLILAGLVFAVAGNGTPLTLNLPLVFIPILIGLLFTAFAFIGSTLATRAKQNAAEQLQNQADEFGRDRRRFLQRLDHEFKNPLTVLRAGISNLSGETTPAEQTTAINTMTNQTGRLVRLTTDLRKIAELETRPLESADTDLTELLTEVHELITEKAAGSRKVILSIPQAPWPLPIIVGDWDLLFLAFYNLADNALKFSADGDTIEIRAREDENNVQIEVADTGIGIPADELPHVWEELYRAENGRAISGSGLGLPLVKAIIERHHGMLILTSRSGQGTNITAQLPKKPAA